MQSPRVLAMPPRDQPTDETGLLTSDVDVEHAPVAPVSNTSRMKRFAGVMAGVFIVLAVSAFAAPSNAKQQLMSRITGHDFIEAVDLTCGTNVITGVYPGISTDAQFCSYVAHNGQNGNLKECILECYTGQEKVCQLMKNSFTSTESMDGWTCMGTLSCSAGSPVFTGSPTPRDKAKDCWVPSSPSSCFPGEATVHTAENSQTRISDVRIGDLIQTSDMAYERVLGWIHQLRNGNDAYLTVSHSGGEFRATGNHLVFVVEGGDRVSKALGDLRVGDEIFVTPSAPPSMILKVHESTSNMGMFAPFTASGTVVVDGVEASIYAQLDGKITHGSAHAAFFPVRAYHAMGLTRLFGHSQNNEMHPFAELVLPLQFLLSK